MSDSKIKSHWNEEWAVVTFQKPTKSCKYEISNYGRIKSINKATGFEKLLKGVAVRGGLIVLNMKLADGTAGYVYVHRFVAENFIDPPTDEQRYILHKDYDRSNNKLDNLKWATELEWKAFNRANPRNKDRKNQAPRNAKLNETQVRLMKKMLLKGKTKRKIIAKQFGVSENCAYKIEKGIRWSHVNITEAELAEED